MECVYCGTKTILFIADRPICVECSDLIDSGKPPKKKPKSEKPESKANRATGSN